MFLLLLTQFSYGNTPELKTNLQSEYLLGHPIQVHLQLRNTGQEPITIPNIELEPWRVGFHLTDDSGIEQVRSSRATDGPPPSFWELQPRQSRAVWVELPIGNAIAEGRYGLKVSLTLQSETLQTDQTSIVIKKPKPLSADLSLLQHPLSHNSNPSIWSHDAEDGFQTYLHHSSLEKPERTVYDGLALSTEDNVHGRLSISQTGTRHIVWQQNDKVILIQAFQNNTPRGERMKLAVPWPKVQLIGSPMTTPNGSPQMLLWIPSPTSDDGGGGGELRLCERQDNGIPIFRKIQALDSPPSVIAQTMTDQGQVVLAFLDKKALLLYTGNFEGQRSDIPLNGQVIFSQGENTQVHDLRFDIQPEEGQVLRVLLSKDNIYYQQSISPSGRELGTIQITEGAEALSFEQFSPHHENPAVAFKAGTEIKVTSPIQTRTMNQPSEVWAMDRHPITGSLWLTGFPTLTQSIIHFETD